MREDTGVPGKPFSLKISASRSPGVQLLGLILIGSHGVSALLLDEVTSFITNSSLCVAAR